MVVMVLVVVGVEVPRLTASRHLHEGHLCGAVPRPSQRRHTAVARRRWIDPHALAISRINVSLVKREKLKINIMKVCFYGILLGWKNANVRCRNTNKSNNGKTWAFEAFVLPGSIQSILAGGAGGVTGHVDRAGRTSAAAASRAL